MKFSFFPHLWRYSCGSRIFLTALHCSGSKRCLMTLGKHDLANLEEQAEVISIETVAVYPSVGLRFKMVDDFSC